MVFHPLSIRLCKDIFIALWIHRATKHNYARVRNVCSKPKQASSSDSIYNVDVAYIPFHGDQHYVDDEFFRRVRARYYVLNAVQINYLTLESLIHGKEQWENKEHVPVSRQINILFFLLL